MDTVTPTEVVVKPGEVSTTGPVMIVLVKTDSEKTNFYFFKKQHEDWLVTVLKAADDADPSKRKVKVELDSSVAFGGYHKALCVDRV